MKVYESLQDAKLVPFCPAIIRVDGRAFHTYTRGMKRPFDENLVQIMINTTKELVKEFNALVGYTQSDEISLLIYQKEIKSQLPFDGRVNKILSISASVATGWFNKFALESGVSKLANFDSRAFSLPNKTEVANYFVWRERDAIRNSIQATAYAKFPQKELFKKNISQLQDMLHTVGTNWNDLPENLKHGTYVVRETFFCETAKAIRSRVSELKTKGITREPHKINFLFRSPSILEQSSEKMVD